MKVAEPVSHALAKRPDVERTRVHSGRLSRSWVGDFWRQLRRFVREIWYWISDPKRKNWTKRK